MERIRTSKRRRVDSHETASRSDSGSPDELSASPPHQQRNVSNGHYITPEPRRASYPDPDDSPDELGTVTPVYRPLKTESHGHQSARESPQRASRSPTATPQDLTPRDLTPRGFTPQDLTPRDTTPVPSPLPPSPSPIPSPRKALYFPYAEKLVMRGHRRGVASVRFSPDGRMIASCSADATLRIWDTNTGKCLHVLEGHLAGISTLAWSPDSRTIASGSDDKSIRLWDTITGKAYPNPLRGHHNYVSTIAFSPKGNMIVSGSYDEAVILWDVRTGRIMRSLPAHSDPVGGVDFIRDGTLIVSCAGDGLIRVWDTMTGQCLKTLVHEDNAPVQSVHFSPNGEYILAWTLDGCVRLWDYVKGNEGKGRCVKTYQGHANAKYGLSGAFGVYGDVGRDRARYGSNIKAFMVSGSEDGGILWWDVISKEVLQRVEGHEGVVLGVDTWEGENGLVVSCGLDKTVRLWERAVPYEATPRLSGEANGDRATE